MNKYTADKIHNVVLLSHGGAGKTSLAEAMLHLANASDRLGKVADGTSVLDYDPEEIKRKISINTSIAPFEWKDNKINLIDTPGYFDFAGEVVQGVRVADGAVIVVHGRSGVQVGTENAWEYASERNIPKIFFVNAMDDENANFSTVLTSLKDKFGTSIAPFRVPIKDGGKLLGFVDIVDNKAYMISGETDTEGEIPSYMESEIEIYRQALIEAAVETDEALMEKYFAGEEINDDELSKAVKSGVKAGEISPVYCGCALTCAGVMPLMNGLCKYFPSAADANNEMAGDTEIVCDESAPLCAMIFKTVADPYVGKMSLFRVFSGIMKADSTVYNASKEANEKIGKLYILRGKKQIETSQIGAGDIGVVTKLMVSATGDTLCDSSRKVVLEKMNFPKPNMSLAILPKAKGDEEKIGTGLNKLVEEDPTFKVENNTETHQMIISGIGELHIDVITSKLLTKFGVSVDLVEPKVAYREAIRKTVKVQGRHKKQSGGHGQFGDVWIEFSPHDGTDLIFEEKIFGGAVPKNFFPAVEKGLRECIGKGVLAGYPVVGLKACLVDGSYHPVDSSEMAFKVAASLAYKEGLKQANPVLLEPIGKLTVKVPDQSMGDIMGDISKRRGRMLGTNPIGKGITEVVAEVPMAEMTKYATDLRSMTQARGKFELSFERYEDAPANIAQKVIESAKIEEE